MPWMRHDIAQAATRAAAHAQTISLEREKNFWQISLWCISAEMIRPVYSKFAAQHPTPMID